MRTQIAGTIGLALLLSSGVGAAPLATKDTVQVESTLSAAGASSQETNLGDLIADAVRQTAGADVALVAADEIDENKRIPAGKVDTNAIISALSFADDTSDTVVILNLTGTQLISAAERSVSRAPQSFDGFMQISGLQIRYNPSQSEGKRVSLVGVGGSEIQAGKTYRVATTRPVAGGSLGYFQIWKSKDIASDTGVSIAKSLTSYLESHRTITNSIEGRISTH